MTLPREVLTGSTYLLTRRIAQRALLLVPSDEVKLLRPRRAPERRGRGEGLTHRDDERLELGSVPEEVGAHDATVPQVLDPERHPAIGTRQDGGGRSPGAWSSPGAERRARHARGHGRRSSQARASRGRGESPARAHRAMRDPSMPSARAPLPRRQRRHAQAVERRQPVSRRAAACPASSSALASPPSGTCTLRLRRGLLARRPPLLFSLSPHAVASAADVNAHLELAAERLRVADERGHLRIALPREAVL